VPKHWEIPGAREVQRAKRAVVSREKESPELDCSNINPIS